MKKLILLLLLIGLPCQAGQFKEFNGVIVNKQMITSVKLNSSGIDIQYPGYCIHTTIDVKDRTQRIKTYNEIKKWLMEK